MGTFFCTGNVARSMVLLLAMSTMAHAESGPAGKSQGLEGQLLFPLQPQHAHGSTIVELPGGDLLAAWFQGSGERQSNDVRILGSRLLQGELEWTAPFVMADVPDFPDINPVLFLDARKKLWLVWYTVMANQWDTSLLKYRTSDDYAQKMGAPNWQWQDVIHVQLGENTGKGIQPGDAFLDSVRQQYRLLDRQVPKELEPQWQAFRSQILARAQGDSMPRKGEIIEEDGKQTAQMMNYPYARRLGWQTKNKAISVGDRLIIPLYSDWLEMSLMAITDDYGEHWHFSTPLASVANIQASIAQRRDGSLVAYMRDNGAPPQRHPMSESRDGGETWSPVHDSQLPNPGSGSDVVTLQNGHWVIAYNDTEQGRHSLAVSLSTDEGVSWQHTRHLELDSNSDVSRRTSFAYPAIIQSADGLIHVSYSYHGHSKGAAIKHQSFSEAWLRQGES